MYSSLQQHLQKHISVSDEEINRFCQFFEEKSLRKKDFLLKQGEICQYETFVMSGLLRMFHINEKGEEQTLQFGVEDWWFTDLDSFFNRVPSRLNIQALENSSVLVLSFENRQLAAEQLPFIQELNWTMLRKSYNALQNRMIDNLSKTADERYLDYLKKYPHIVKRLSNIHIASYLGVSPESLSRIKNKIFSPEN